LSTAKKFGFWRCVCPRASNRAEWGGVIPTPTQPVSHTVAQARTTALCPPQPAGTRPSGPKAKWPVRDRKGPTLAEVGPQLLRLAVKGLGGRDREEWTRFCPVPQAPSPAGGQEYADGYRPTKASRGSASMIQVCCPTCGKTMSTPEENAGQIGSCPCGERIRIPGEAISKKPASAPPAPIPTPATAPVASPVGGKPRKMLWIVLPVAGVACVAIGLAVFLVTRGSKSSSAAPKTPLEEFKVIVERVGNVKGRKNVGKRDKPTFADFSIENLPPGKGKDDWLKEDQEDRRRFQQGYVWIVWWSSVNDVAFDVQKTDSLVSPYTGYIEFTVSDTGTDWLLKAQADGDDFHKYFKTVKREKVRAFYAYQNGRWVEKSLENKKDEPDATWKPTTFADWWTELDRALTP
jgi:hypothetical protein